VVTVPEALDNPQVKHRELLQSFDNVPGVDRPIRVTRAGFKLSGANSSTPSPPPRLGEHTEEVLLSVGYTAAEIARLRKARAI
jgi:crotonobetainyl-CoA:carnitine CoA-transferase CaiB-like acyl-CoA transferase